MKLDHEIAKGKAALRALAGQVVETLYPAACLACRNPTETAVGLCGACWRDAHFLAGNVCDICGAPVPQTGVADRLICDACTHAPPAWGKGRCAVAYEGAGRRIVLKLKHGDRADMAPTLARWMSGAGATVADSADLAVPVPLHRFRLFARRYNQAAELARHLAARLAIPHCPDALIRTRATPPQKGRRADRFAAMAGAFAVNPRRAAAIRGRRILLIDDVITTGATLSACAECLTAAGAANVDVLALARVVRED